ncbi:MAG: protein kinase [Candidatus Aureabacteria bacterium]|nr:protein kinase [Candidatus Auribacterota bacterium]
MAFQDLKGKKIGGCEIIRKVGKGGMGVIYEARQSSLGRKVAIKFLAPHLAHDEEFVSRFMREARSAAVISHPHVMQVIDVGRNGELVYMVSEFVRGKNLREIVKEKGVFPEHEALSVIRDVASALVEAWKNNIVHRDLKPDNIMITDTGLVKVMDFGLAKDTSSATQAITHTGSVLGTPQYMSPEQIRGENVDIRSDIYSLGLILYFLVTGKRAFDGDSSVKIYHDQVYTPLPDPKELKPDLLEPVRSMIIKMARKDPSERFQSPAEIIEAVDLLQKDAKGFEKTIGKQNIAATVFVPKKKKTKAAPYAVVACLTAATVLVVFVLSLLYATFMYFGYAKLPFSAIRQHEIEEDRIVLVWDLQGKITFINQYGQDCLGYDTGEIQGRDIIGTIVPDTEGQGDELREMISGIEKDPEKYRDNFSEGICSNGSTIFVKWTHSPVYDNEGKVLEIYSEGNVVSDMLEVERLMEQKRQRLQSEQK